MNMHRFTMYRTIHSSIEIPDDVYRKWIDGLKGTTQENEGTAEGQDLNAPIIEYLDKENAWPALDGEDEVFEELELAHIEEIKEEEEKGERKDC